MSTKPQNGSPCRVKICLLSFKTYIWFSQCPIFTRVKVTKNQCISDMYLAKIRRKSQNKIDFNCNPQYLTWARNHGAPEREHEGDDDDLLGRDVRQVRGVRRRRPVHANRQRGLCQVIQWLTLFVCSNKEQNYRAYWIMWQWHSWRLAQVSRKAIDILLSDLATWSGMANGFSV